MHDLLYAFSEKSFNQTVLYFRNERIYVLLNKIIFILIFNSCICICINQWPEIP